MVEFDCQEEGDGDDDGWQDDEEDPDLEAKELTAEEMKDEEDMEGGDAGEDVFMQNCHGRSQFFTYATYIPWSLCIYIHILLL